MAETITKLVCCITLLALVGTVSGAGYCALEYAGFLPHNENAVSGRCGISGKTKNPCLICKDNIYVKCQGLEFWPRVWCGMVENGNCNLLCFFP